MPRHGKPRKLLNARISDEGFERLDKEAARLSSGGVPTNRSDIVRIALHDYFAKPESARPIPKPAKPKKATP